MECAEIVSRQVREEKKEARTLRTPKRPIMQAAAATEKYADKRYQTNRTPSSLYFSEPSHSDSVSHRRDFQRVRSCKAAARLRKVPQRARARVAVLEYGEIMRRKVLGGRRTRFNTLRKRNKVQSSELAWLDEVKL